MPVLIFRPWNGEQHVSIHCDPDRRIPPPIEGERRVEISRVEAMHGLTHLRAKYFPAPVEPVVFYGS